MTAPPSVVSELRLRPMAEADRNYILSSWLRSYAGRSREAREYGAIADFYADYSPVVEALMARSTVTVACLIEAPDVIVAWSCVEDGAFHYLLVKPRWRHLGVAQWMVAPYADWARPYTHATGDALRAGIPPKWQYRRFKIWPTKGETQ